MNTSISISAELMFNRWCLERSAPGSSHTQVVSDIILECERILGPATAEVAYILEIPLDELLDPARLRHGRSWRGDEAITVPYFELHAERVWGATAMVLGELLDLLQSNPEGDGG